MNESGAPVTPSDCVSANEPPWLGFLQQTFRPHGSDSSSFCRRQVCGGSLQRAARMVGLITRVLTL